MTITFDELLVAYALLAPFIAVALLLSRDIDRWLFGDPDEHEETETERPYDWERA